MITIGEHNNFNILRYVPDSSKGKLPRLGGIMRVHRNEIGPILCEDSLCTEHPLIHALMQVRPNIEMSILTDPFEGLIEEGQRSLIIDDQRIDPNRIADKRYLSEMNIEPRTREQKGLIKALLKRSGEILQTTGELFQDCPVLSLHADQPHDMSLPESLEYGGSNSFTYGYIAWNTKRYRKNHIQGLWNSFTETLPAPTLVARNSYLRLPEQALGNIDMRIRNGLIKLPDPIADGTFENQLVVNGISPLTICYEMPLVPLSMQQEIMANFLRRFLSPLLLK